jgi:hypothetical protein
MNSPVPTMTPQRMITATRHSGGGRKYFTILPNIKFYPKIQAAYDQRASEISDKVTIIMLSSACEGFSFALGRTATVFIFRVSA